MDNIKEIILSILGTALPLIITIITIIIKNIKNNKVKKGLIISQFFLQEVAKYVKKAETLDHATGKEKKEFVMNNVNKIAIDNKIPFDHLKVSAMIEDLIGFSKKVNAKIQDINLEEYKQSTTLNQEEIRPILEDNNTTNINKAVAKKDKKVNVNVNVEVKDSKKNANKDK